MKLYKKVWHTRNEYNYYVRDRLRKGTPLPLGARWSGNIDAHIMQRAGLFPDLRPVNGHGIVDTKRMCVRMYGKDGWSG